MKFHDDRCKGSAVEIHKSFVRHRSDTILEFVGPNKILSDQTFIKPIVTPWKNVLHMKFKVLQVPTKTAR